jgi:dCMP deaminase
MCHSIMNAIMNKNQSDLRGCRIYATKFPCDECAKILVQSGITRVIYSNPDDEGRGEAARILFTVAGISVSQFRMKNREHIELELR